ncbi:hypothetical protein ACPDHN_05590 [Myroides odoratimimus]|uniref:hypothetical protein n=1 Tax=Myroides odoratimimus TaxID=76832 RepID=UPI003D2F8F82
MIKRTAYILIGDNNTGKTTFQKMLIKHLTGKSYTTLPTDLIHTIIHPESPRKLETLFTMNRSIQEKMTEEHYTSVSEYFEKKFKDADICIMSSHAGGKSITEIEEMINILQEKYYNVEAVFFTNSIDPSTSEISKLKWNSRNMIQNDYNEDWESFLTIQAQLFGDMIIRYAKLN